MEGWRVQTSRLSTHGRNGRKGRKEGREGTEGTEGREGRGGREGRDGRNGRQLIFKNIFCYMFFKWVTTFDNLYTLC